MKKIFFIAGLLVSSNLLAQPFILNKGGTSHLPFPIKDSKSNWYIFAGSPYHYGSDKYADDWNLKAGLSAGSISSTSCNRDKGAEVIASLRGTVLHADIDDSVGLYGKEVIIQSADDPSFAMRYSHLDTVDVREDEFVEFGDGLGTVGNTGLGGNGCAHLHLVLYKNLNSTALHNLKKGKPPKSTSGAADNFAAKFSSDATTTVPTLLLNRSEALKTILDKFEISTLNAGFNNSIFGEPLTVPSDVSNSTINYDYIVTAYNKGIAKGSNGLFNPSSNITFAEFIIMIVRAIPIPLEGNNGNSYSYDSTEWYYKYANVAFNAGLINNQDYSFNNGIDFTVADEVLNRAYEYYLGSKSGISIYAKWSKKYADIDLYLYSSYDGGSLSIEHDNNYQISNMTDLKNSGGIVYWGEHSSSWGANLDYDSWGANGNQPWAGVGEERVTVDSQEVKRPGEYAIILCYYDWGIAENPLGAEVQWWGINAGENINTGGNNFITTVKRDTCQYSGTLNTK